MLFWILVILQIITGIVAGEATIRKTVEGETTLHALSKAGFFFLHWRAYANYKKELLGLRRLFGIAAIIFSSIFYVLGNDVATGTPLITLSGLFIFLWMAMEFGTDFKTSIRKQFSVVWISVVGSWGIYLLDYLTNFQHGFIQQLARPLAIVFGVAQLSDLQAIALISIMGLISGVVMVVFSVVFFSMVPLFFLFLMSTTSILSRRALMVSPNTAYNVSGLYFFLIGPLLIALESKGVI